MKSVTAPATTTTHTTTTAILPAHSRSVTCHGTLPLGAAALAMGCLHLGALLGTHAGHLALPLGAISLALLLGHAGGIHRRQIIRKYRCCRHKAENQRSIVEKSSIFHHVTPVNLLIRVEHQVAFLTMAMMKDRRCAEISVWHPFVTVCYRTPGKKLHPV